MLEATAIRKHYKAPGRVVRALDGVSFELGPGQRRGLVGHSGSGKSTLGQVMSLLLKPDAGELSIDGEPVRKWGVSAPRRLRQQVQLIWQSPRLASDPRLRLREMILEPLAASGRLPRDRGARKALLEEWADRVGITPELLERFPHEVSDGQLQRACLARALVLEPAYLVCDEVSSMLDVSTQAAILDVLASVQAERPVGIVLITHDHVLARHWCEDITEIADGQITAYGVPAAVDEEVPVSPATVPGS